MNIYKRHIEVEQRISEFIEAESNILSLYNLNLEEIPSQIFDLSNIRILNISNNFLKTIPNEILKLNKLEELYLSENQITKIPSAAKNFHNVKILDLSNNALTNYPDEISNLSSLEHLNLSFNNISKLEKSVLKLNSLTNINLSGNIFLELPYFLAKIKSLRKIDLSKNRIKDIKKYISHFIYITELNLSCNHLSKIPCDVQVLSNLSKLDVSTNNLTELPEEIVKLSSLKEIKAEDNPLQKPPLEIVAKGRMEIANYFKQIKIGKDYLYEAKLLILGESGAGKTTLAKKILNPDYDLNDAEQSTEGIDVLKWKFQTNKSKQFTVNMWDFGGQEIYHATHQFFLTKRSLYVLVADTRKEDTDFYYWMNIIELLGGKSPLLIIKNEKQGRKREINENLLRYEFSNYKDTMAFDLAERINFEHVLKNIKKHISYLPHIGNELPKTWIKVREILEKNPKNFVFLSDYLKICEENGFDTLNDKLQLSGYLHDLGVSLHFQDDPILKHLVILKPKWGTNAVYKVLGVCRKNNF